MLGLLEGEGRDCGGNSDLVATRVDSDHTRAAAHLNRRLRRRCAEHERQVHLRIEWISLVGEEVHAARAHVAGAAGSVRELYRQREGIAPRAPGRGLLVLLHRESPTKSATDDI